MNQGEERVQVHLSKFVQVWLTYIPDIQHIGGN